MAVHHLNNIIHPIPAPDAPIEEDPNVLVAVDDGMEEDTPAEPKDLEIEPFEDARVMACLMLIAIIPRFS